MLDATFLVDNKPCFKLLNLLKKFLQTTFGLSLYSLQTVGAIRDILGNVSHATRCQIRLMGAEIPFLDELGKTPVELSVGVHPSKH